jgi:hypothetical protein
MNKSLKLITLLLALSTIALLCSADIQPTNEMGKTTVVIYRHSSFMHSIGLEPFVEIAVGVLALLLFLISALAYYRDRRKKFLIVCMAFLIFTIKGLLGVLDIFYPGDSSMLGTFADLLDFIILILLLISVLTT